MSKTVVGIFEYESDAQNAQNYLLANGFGDGDVDLKVASNPSGETETDEGLFEKIGHFFRELFLDDHDETERYVEASKRGTIVTVHATSADEALAAAHIMDEYGALDIKDGETDRQPGELFEDPIVNPPSVSSGDQVMPASVEARGPYLRSRIIDRPLQPEYRLRQNPYANGNGSPEATELHKTIAERDALINEIVDNDDLKSDQPQR